MGGGRSALPSEGRVKSVSWGRCPRILAEPRLLLAKSLVATLQALQHMGASPALLPAPLIDMLRTSSRQLVSVRCPLRLTVFCSPFPSQV